MIGLRILVLLRRVRLLARWDLGYGGFGAIALVRFRYFVCMFAAVGLFGYCYLLVVLCG